MAIDPRLGKIPIENLTTDPDQPRVEFDEDEIEALARSLKDRGQLQPIRVRRPKEVGNPFVIVAGERRFRAALKAGMGWLDCVIEDGEIVAIDRYVDQLVENCCRSDLRPIEKAEAFRKVIEAKGCSARSLAELTGVSESTVSRSLALLELPLDLQQAVARVELSPSVAIELSRLDDAPKREALTAEAIKANWTRGQASAAVRARGGRLGTDEEDSKPNSLELARCKVLEKSAPVEPWRLKALIENPSIPHKAIEALRLRRIDTFGKLDDEFKKGSAAWDLGGHAQVLWPILQGEKGGRLPEPRAPSAKGEGRDVPKPPSPPRSLPIATSKPSQRVYNFRASNGIDLILEGSGNWTVKDQLDAVNQLRVKLEREFLAPTK